VYIGYNTKASANLVTNENVFGNDATGSGSNTTTIGNSAITATNIFGNITTAGTINALIFNSTSDENKKTNIKVIPNALGIVENIRGVTFDWKSNSLPSAGLIAQDVEKYLPELISTTDDAKTLNYNGVIGVLVEAIKELSDRIKVLENARTHTTL
jgi:hypothetical protein